MKLSQLLTSRQGVAPSFPVHGSVKCFQLDHTTSDRVGTQHGRSSHRTLFSRVLLGRTPSTTHHSSVAATECACQVSQICFLFLRVVALGGSQLDAPSSPAAGATISLFFCFSFHLLLSSSFSYLYLFFFSSFLSFARTLSPHTTRRTARLNEYVHLGI